MINRVVSTVTAWGRRDGYFVDGAEADAFRDELTALILHQRAAFNSPVWFNIGVMGAPQQASACQPYDALVSTPEGMIPIGRLVEEQGIGAKVFDAHGLTQVVAVKANGRKPVLRLHTKAGYQLDVTADHLVWRASGDASGRFVPAGELQPGDKLEWHRTESHGEGEISRLAVAEAALAGWLQSDGFVGRYQGTNRSLTIEAMTVTDAEKAWVLDAIDTVFPDVHRHERRVVTADTSLDCRRTRLYGAPLEDFVERWDLMTRGVDMAVPEHLFTAPLPVVAAYLRSVFQAEGYVSVRPPSAVVGLAMVSQSLVRGVQSLLLRFGIFSRVRFAPDSRADRKGCLVLSIRTAGDRRRFADEIGFIDPVKAAKLEASLELPGLAARPTKRLEIERIEEIGETEVYDIQTESGEYLSGNVRVHNCFILAVEDTMRSILNWYTEEGIIFQGGSGSGVNLSTIRSSYEHLKGGGTASGPVSFMRGADASAGTIKSGGKTRRAAKMVILNADHPDVEDFIWCKAVEERKARVLRDNGFDMDLDGKDSHSTQYQNANNSVRVTDEFMQAVVDDADWHLRAVTTGDPVRTVKARDLFRQIAEAAWECADPGMQFDTTINTWHTASNTGRINASNPCFTGDSLVHTDKGLIRFDALLDRVRAEETFGVYTHDATNPEAPAQRLEITSPEAFMITGTNEIVRLRFDNGMQLRCTAGHKLFTVNRGYVPASELTGDDQVKVLDLPAPAVNADLRLPVSTEVRDYSAKGDWSRSLRLPEKWSPELAHYLGWLVGDGCIAGDVVTSVYGGGDDQQQVLPRHLELLTWLHGDRAPKPSVQANGTMQLRQSRRVVARFLEALGLTHSKAAEKVVPWSVEQAPEEAVAAFLQGLFDADGCVVDGTKSRYVGLGSASEDLLRGVQRLLTTFGIFSRIYDTRASESAAFQHVRKDGTIASYTSKPMHDLRISGRSIEKFSAAIGFSVQSKAEKLAVLLSEHSFYSTKTTARLVEITDDGVELTYNLSEPRNHSYVVNGLVVRNCSEYMHLDNSACNLASLNLLKFLHDDGSFDVEGFRAAVRVVFTAQEILVGNADYPTESIADTSRRFRQLGLGYANLGAMLMALGAAYDSDAGRAWAAAITALMTGEAYATSARTAARMGPFAGYAQNKEPMNRVLGMHRDALDAIDRNLAPSPVVAAAVDAWDDAVGLAEIYGVRNSQATVLAPTGCLVGGTLVPTERGLVRLRSLGDTDGEQWQDLGIDVATDVGARTASKFYVNGLEPVVTVDTTRGYRIQGTPQHRVKVVDDATGTWAWKRLADVGPGDLVPLALRQLMGEPQEVALPPLPEAFWTGEHQLHVPRRMTADLAELIGHFMAGGTLHAGSLRFWVDETDFDVVERLERLAKEVFGVPTALDRKRDHSEVVITSVRLVLWWEACGFAKHTPSEAAGGKGYVAHIPDALLHSNDPEVYRAFLRGLFESGGTVEAGMPTFESTSLELARDVQALLLALRFPTSRRLGMVRLLNLSYARRWAHEIGFVGDRKNRSVAAGDTQAGSLDHVPVTREIVDRLLPSDGDRLRQVLLMELARGRVGRRTVTELHERTADREVGHLLGFFYDRVVSAELGDEELTYDLSVPENVTYVANGFISHNTIGLMMDCDTTGIEPDLGLCKTKKLVGGGTMSIVNQTVPRALRRMGYGPDQVNEILAYIDLHKSILGAPHLSAEHLSVFACSMGDNVIHYLGHVKMMSAVQPWISGAISKTVNVPESATVDEVEQLHIDAWRLGLKALAIYRDNCKVGQPLSTTKTDKAIAEAAAKLVEAVVMPAEAVGPVRERLPRRRNSKTFSFRVADCHGYVTVGEYDDGRPGEIFLRVAKQGSTLAGIMDAFAISVSHGLQYGVPLKAFVDMYTNMRFEPAGMTDDPDIRFASSLVDYIFRRLAVEYLTYEERVDLGILTIDERMQPTLPGVEEHTTPTSIGSEVTPDPASRPAAVVAAIAVAPVAAPMPQASDAPYCYQCGMVMQRAGACFVCSSCGTTSGCS